MNFIKIRGARVNNLKNIDLDIPINKITTLIGPSGSGKSSIAFHTLFSESKRRFLNSFPTYLKFFSDRPSPVDVDLIEPVLPVFGLPQNNPIVGTRSNAADIMQLTTLLEQVFYEFGEYRCPTHNLKLEKVSTSDQIKKQISFDDNSKIHFFIKRSDFIIHFKDTPFPSRSMNLNEDKVRDFNSDDGLWEVARIKGKSIDSVDKKIDDYLYFELFVYIDGAVKKLDIQTTATCPKCDYSADKRLMRSYFSAYNAMGACSECSGFGANLVYDRSKYLNLKKSIIEEGIKILHTKRFSTHEKHFLAEAKKKKINLKLPLVEQDESFFEFLHEGKGKWIGINRFFKYLESKKYKAPVRIYIRGIQKEEICKVCDGSRVSKKTHSVYVNDHAYKGVWQYTIDELYNFTSKIKINDKRKNLITNINRTLKKAIDLGLGHLKINRKAKSLSSGEYQRLLLLKYLSYEGTGALFIFDEPSLGLDSDETRSLFHEFQELVKQGNTVLLVEHNQFLIDSSDEKICVGPGAGEFGGQIVEAKKKIAKISLKKNNKKNKKVTINSCEIYDKKYENYDFMNNAFNVVVGKSGTGKTARYVNGVASFINNLDGENKLNVPPAKLKTKSKLDSYDGAIVINSNINKFSSRSTVGSLTGFVSVIRKHFLKLPQVKSMGLKEGHLSPNSDLGQCPKCQGRGINVIEMQFLEDVVLTCDECDGKKIKSIYANISDGNLEFYKYLTMPMNKYMDNIKLTPKFMKIWQSIKALNLDYLSLDRQISSLSGGEKQRVYLLSKLNQNLENHYIVFENITFGLSVKEQIDMVGFLMNLSANNTVVAIDQSDIFKKSADYLINIDS
ncbi:MAG: hypothetical protein N4A33_09840 [Bacteriovoracaceae bacterium]|jgi:excinuclease ABC subunit A|nr:hypothetical protein [Bacteriovoracaceae bacterium]